VTREPDSEWWVSITHSFQAHVREETAFLERYERAVEQADDPAITFLLRMILDDEHRHHALFEEMSAAALGERDGLPRVPSPTPACARELLEPTERFLDAERADGEQLRRLRKELGPVRDETLWPLLVELMEIDTRKHVLVLEYLRSRLRAVAAE